jgi:hypothetical protein
VGVGVFVVVGVRDADGVLVSVGVRVGVGVVVGVKVLLGVFVGGRVKVAVGDGEGVSVCAGVCVSEGVEVRLAVGIMDGVGEVVAVAVGTSRGASKRISAAKSAAVTCPSPFTSASAQPPSVSLKMALMTADMSVASSTPSQSASPGGNCAAAADVHTKQHAAAQCATKRVKPRRRAEIIWKLAQASNALPAADLQYDRRATYWSLSTVLLQASPLTFSLSACRYVNTFHPTCCGPSC